VTGVPACSATSSREAEVLVGVLDSSSSSSKAAFSVKRFYNLSSAVETHRADNNVVQVVQHNHIAAEC